jgi:hypothetical protein
MREKKRRHIFQGISCDGGAVLLLDNDKYPTQQWVPKRIDKRARDDFFLHSHPFGFYLMRTSNLSTSQVYASQRESVKFFVIYSCGMLYVVLLVVVNITTFHNKQGCYSD